MTLRRLAPLACALVLALAPHAAASAARTHVTSAAGARPDIASARARPHAASAANGQAPAQPAPGAPTAPQPSPQTPPSQTSPPAQPRTQTPTAPPDAARAPQVPAPQESLSPQELNRLFEAYALLQAQTMLRLSDEQYGDFIVRLKALQTERRRHQQARHRMIVELRKLTDPRNAIVDENAVRTTLDNLAREEASSYEAITKATVHLDELLDVQQRARFRVFEEQLEQKKLELLSRVRRAARDKAAPKS